MPKSTESCFIGLGVWRIVLNQEWIIEGRLIYATNIVPDFVMAAKVWDIL